MEKLKHNKDASITSDWLLGSDLPDSKQYSIGKLSKLCFDVKPHVIRYWESQFKQLQPQRQKERRYYTKSDVVHVRNIYNLVYAKRYTVQGAKSLLEENKVPGSDSSLKSFFASADLKNIINSLENIDNDLVGN